jgi:D-arabinose 1-dehydrogenase-like Zn-dependent alcohol dehydrogenase
VNCALSQVIFGLHGGLRFGGSVVIQGAGGLGLQAAAVAKDMGAATVIVVDQLAAPRAGARLRRRSHDQLKEVPTARTREPRAQVDGGAGADVACDFVGFPQVMPRASRCCARRDLSRDRHHQPRRQGGARAAQLVVGRQAIVGVIMYDPGSSRARSTSSSATGRAGRSTAPLAHAIRSSRSTRPSPTPEWHAKEPRASPRRARALALAHRQIFRL